MTGWRAFLVVWLGQLVSTFGTGPPSFALSVWILQRTGSITQFALAAVVCLYFIGISLSDGSSQALWQAKVAPDFQGRVFALRDMIAASAFPIGLLITAPLAELVLGPALMPGDAWASSIGRGVGLGAGATMPSSA